MSVISIKCDQMDDGWNYDTCLTCWHFSISITAKGRQWRCSLNSKPVSLKRAFRLIWATEYLRGCGLDISKDEITIEYIGKRRRTNGYNK